MVWEGLDLTDAPETGPVAFRDDLSPATLLDAYRHGLFPFPVSTEEQRFITEITYEADVAAGRIAVFGADPYGVAWWSPDPRPVLFVDQFRMARSLRQQLRNKVDWTTTLNACFDEVVERCRVGRKPQWLTDRLVSSLRELHAAGHAHSVEVWDGDELVGGAFGMRVGGVFSGDSHFTVRSGAGKVAIASLVRRVAESGGIAIDFQHGGAHATLMGAVPVPRVEYLALLRKHVDDGDAMFADPLPGRSLAT